MTRAVSHPTQLSLIWTPPPLATQHVSGGVDLGSSRTSAGDGCGVKRPRRVSSRRIMTRAVSHPTPLDSGQLALLWTPPPYATQHVCGRRKARKVRFLEEDLGRRLSLLLLLLLSSEHISFLTAHAGNLSKGAGRAQAHLATTCSRSARVPPRCSGVVLGMVLGAGKWQNRPHAGSPRGCWFRLGDILFAR